MKKSNLVLLIIFIVCSTGIALFIAITFLPHPHEAELKAAVENSKSISRNAMITLDATQLSQGYTGKSLTEIERIVNLEKTAGLLFIDIESEIASLDVLKYEPPTAIVEVKWYQKNHLRNRATGVITPSQESDEWWIYRYKMHLEDDAWKMEEALEFVGHGGY